MFNYTGLQTAIGDSAIYDRALSGWYISQAYCYSDDCKFYFNWEDGHYQYTFDAKTLAQNFTEYWDYVRLMKICARFSGCAAETCSYFSLPPNYAPQPTVSPYNATLKVNQQVHTLTNDEYYEISEDDYLELELPQSCNLLYHQLRLYSNTELECSRFNTCRGGNEYSIRLDKDCELRPMTCTAGTCEDYNFETFTGCEEVTVSGATRWKCIKTYANNTQTCVYAANLERP